MIACFCSECSVEGYRNLSKVNKSLLGIQHGAKIHPNLYGDASNLEGLVPQYLEGDVSLLAGWMSGYTPIGKINKLSGCISFIGGNLTGIWGHIGDKLIGNVSNITGCITGISGRISNIYGDVSNIIGNTDNIYGEVSGLKGDVSSLKGEAEKLVSSLEEYDPRPMGQRIIDGLK